MRLRADSELVQLNTILLACWDMPSGGSVNPVLHMTGYTLVAIGKSYPVPAIAIVRSQPTLPINRVVAPDVTLTNKEARQNLLVELKAHGFGIGSDGGKLKQARGMICVAGEVLQGLLNQPSAPKFESVSTYAVAHPDEDSMSETLSHLRSELQTRSISPLAEVSAWGFEVCEDGLYLIVHNTDSGNLRAIAGRHRVIRAEYGELPMPLFIIPVDPSASTSASVEAVEHLEELLRINLAATIGGGIGPRVLTFAITDVLRKAIPVWDIWHEASRDRLATQAGVYVRRVLHVLGERIGLEYSLNRGIVEIPPVPPGTRRRILAFLRSQRFRAGDLEPGLKQLTFDLDSPD